jgi:sec-independent protein translocase protein TatB
MFDFDAGKLIVIGIVALIVIGPKELPRVLRQVGQAVGKMRRMAAEFQGQFMDAMREADLEDIRKDVAKLADSAKVDVNFDPVQTIRNEIGGAIEGTSGQTASVPTQGDAGHSLNSIDMSGLPTAAAPGEDSMASGIGPVTPEAVESAAPSVPLPPVAPASTHAAARTGEA